MTKKTHIMFCTTVLAILWALFYKLNSPAERGKTIRAMYNDVCEALTNEARDV